MANEFLDLSTPAAGGGATFVVTVEPSAGGAGIQAAVDAAFAAGGGIVQLLAGDYIISAPIISDQDMNNVHIRGVGAATRLIHPDSFGNHMFQVKARQVKVTVAVNAVAIGATAITTTLAGQASGILAGDFIYLSGDVALGGRDSEFLRAAADGDGGTGNISLVGKVAKAYTTADVWVSRNNYNNIISDVSFHCSALAPISPLLAINMQQSMFGAVERVIIDKSFSNAAPYAGSVISFSGPGFFNTAEDLLIEDVSATGIAMGSQISFELKNATVIHAELLVADTGAIRVVNCSDGFVKGCSVLSCSGIGISLIIVGGQTTRRVRVETCDVKNCDFSGIDISSCADVRLESNTIENCPIGLDCFPGTRVVYHGNTVRGCSGAQVRFRAVSDSSMVNNLFIDPNPGCAALLLSAASNGNIVSSNTLVDCQLSGIYLTDASNNAVMGNTIDGCASVAAIRIVDNSDNNLVQGNSVINSAVPGILVGNDCDSNIVVYNNVNGAGITVGAGVGNDFTGNKV